MYKIIIIFFLTGINSFAQNDTLKAEQAKNYLSKEVIIKGYIASTRLFDKDGKKIFLINLDKRYPENPLTVVLYDAAYKALNLKAEIEEKNLVVKGVVVLYKDKPQIVVEDIKNLKIF